MEQILDWCLTLSIISMVIFTVGLLVDSHLKNKKYVGCFVSIILFITLFFAPFLYLTTAICLLMHTVLYNLVYGEPDKIRFFIFMAIVFWGFFILELHSDLYEKDKTTKNEVEETKNEH